MTPILNISRNVYAVPTGSKPFLVRGVAISKCVKNHLYILGLFLTIYIDTHIYAIYSYVASNNTFNGFKNIRIHSVTDEIPLYNYNKPYDGLCSTCTEVPSLIAWPHEWYI